LAIFVVWIFLAPFLAEYLVIERPLDHADAIVILAGASAYLERTRTAAHLFKKRVAQKVLLTNDGEQAGWSQEEQRNPPYVELARKQLLAHGVPGEAIEILSPEVFGTITEAKILAKHASERRWKYLLIVTSAYHTRRASWTFNKVFSENAVRTEIGIVHATTEPRAPPATYWWLTWKGWRDVAGEYVKSAYYYFAYQTGSRLPDHDPATQ